MNIVFFSPHFPPNYYQFCVNLKLLGATVLGLADLPYESLQPELKESLAEYYRVDDMQQYDKLLRALGYFTHHHGKIDRIDSLNEFWLEIEAKLRTDFNIFGLKTEQMPHIKRKSRMKETYKRIGIDVARGKIVRRIHEAKQLIEEIGYPVVAKPDVGVGAARTYKIHNLQELEQFYTEKPTLDYIMEEYIDGIICSFDGLTDRDGNLVFYTAHQFSQGIMETVNTDSLIYYYSLRQIPPDLEHAGRAVLRAFDVRERFFHFEFFRCKANDRLVALEVNLRPPGGLTTDMFNFANNIDIYREWANVVVNNRFNAQYSRDFHACYIGRKCNRSYAHTQEQILAAYGQQLMHHEPISGIFSAALGDYGYLVRSPELAEVLEIVDYIQRLA